MNLFPKLTTHFITILHYNQDGVLALLYVLETVTHQVRKALRKSGLNVRIAQKSGPTLRSVLTTSALERPQCPGCRDCLACLAGLQGKCGTKNVVYHLVCALCHEVYVGGTTCPVRDRLMEHRRGARNRDTDNPWGAHYAIAHKDDPVPAVPFQAKMIARPRDHVDRKLPEVIYIAEESPALNTDRGWQLLPTIQTRLTGGTRLTRGSV